MENIILNLNNQITLTELISYFSPELICALGVILNLFLFLFFKRKSNAKRISDFITNGALILSLLFLSGICINSFLYNQNYEVYFINNLFVLDKSIILTKISLNVILLLFMFTHYKLNRKIKIKTPILNSILLLLLAVGNILISSTNMLLIFFFLDLSVFLIYKYASNMRIRQYEIYCPDFVFISFCSSFLFYSFYLCSLFIRNDLQLNIINVCLFLAVILKMGLFPFYNYQIDKNYKTNSAYSFLLFVYLPYLGICSFNKMSLYQNFNSNACFISIIAFILFAITIFSIFALKQKNLVKFFANTNSVFNLLVILNIIIFGYNNFNIKAGFNFAILFLGLYSLLAILKLNYNPNKINFNLITSIFFNNRFFAVLLSMLILIMSSIIYSGITASFLSIIKSFYLFDIYAFVGVILIIFAFMMILINSLKLIQNVYCFDKNLIKKQLKKRTTINYVVPVFSILFLVVKIFL